MRSSRPSTAAPTRFLQRIAGHDGARESFSRSDPSTALAAAVARLEQGLRELALELVRQHVEQLEAAGSTAPGVNGRAARSRAFLDLGGNVTP